VVRDAVGAAEYCPNKKAPAEKGFSCRQWDWVGRQRARELKLSEDELVVARQEIDSLYDDLYVLACAVDDTERELKAGKPTVTSLKEAMEWIMDAARPLRDRTLTPSSQPD
jgi:hypothetical protein